MIYIIDLQFFIHYYAKEKYISYPHDSIMKHLSKFVASVPEFRKTSKGKFQVQA